IAHDDQVVGHEGCIFAHVVAVGGAALQDEIGGVQIGAGKVLGDDQHLAPAGNDCVTDVRVTSQVAAAHAANDGKVVFGQAAGALQLSGIIHEQLDIAAHHHHFALEVVADVPQKVVGEIGRLAAA